MIKIDTIFIKKIFEDTEPGNSRLEFNIKGSNIDYVIMNTIRRILLSNIPIYAFAEFNFIKNTSVFHNNYLKLRISNMPVWGIKNNIEILPSNSNSETKLSNNNLLNETSIEETISDEEDIVNNSEVKSDFEYSSLKELTLYVNYTNNSQIIESVTTNHAKFYYNKNQIESPYKTPILLVKLQPQQEIEFSAITNLNCEDHDTIYSAVSIAIYKQISDNEFNFIVESRGQITEFKAINVAIANIHHQLALLNTKLKDIDMKEYENKALGTIEFQSMDATLGNLISRGLQLHSKIDFAGYNTKHPLIQCITIHYKIKESNIINILFEVIEYLNNLFKSFIISFNKMK